MSRMIEADFYIASKLKGKILLRHIVGNVGKLTGRIKSKIKAQPSKRDWMLSHQQARNLAYN